MNQSQLEYGSLKLYEEGLKNIGFELAANLPCQEFVIVRQVLNYQGFNIANTLSSGIREYGKDAFFTWYYSIDEMENFCKDLCLPGIFINIDEKLFKGCLEFFDNSGKKINGLIRRNLELAYDSAWLYFRGKELF